MKQKLLQLLLCFHLVIWAQDPDLIRSYQFDNSLRDSSATALHITHTSLISYGHGRFCDAYGAAYFPQTYGLVVPFAVNTVNTLALNQYTYSVWAKVTNASPSNKMHIFAVGSTTGEHSIFINNEGFGATFSFNTTATSLMALQTTPTTDQWYHLVSVKRADSIMLFINGKLEHKQAVASSEVCKYASNNATVGSIFGQGMANYSGFIDAVKVFKRDLSHAEIKQLYDADKARLCHKLPIRGLIRDYQLNGNLSDSSNYKAHLVASNQIYINDRFCKAQKAILTRSSTTALNIPMRNTDGTLLLSQDYTYSAWVRPRGITGIGSIVSIGSSTGDQNLYLSKTSFHASSYYTTPSSTDRESVICNGTTIPQTNAWYHVASVKIKDTLFLYVNGALEGKTTLPTGHINHFGSKPFGYVSRRTMGGGALNAFVDDVKIYDKGLKATEIFALYNQNLGAICPVGKDSLVRDYRFSNNYADSSTYMANCVIGNSGSTPSFDKGHTCDENGAFKHVIFSRVTTPATEELLGGVFTYSVWVMPQMVISDNIERPIICLGIANSEQSLIIAKDYYMMRCNPAQYQSNLATSNTAPQVNAWQHVTCVKTADSIYMYINGTLETKTKIKTGSYLPANPQLGIGCRPPENTEYGFPGFISDVKIYNVALKSTDILRLYRATKPLPSCFVSEVNDRQTNTENAVDVFVDEQQTLHIVSESKILSVTLTNTLGQSEYFGAQQQIRSGQKGLLIAVIQTDRGTISRKILVP